MFLRTRDDGEWEQVEKWLEMSATRSDSRADAPMVRARCWLAGISSCLVVLGLASLSMAQTPPPQLTVPPSSASPGTSFSLGEAPLPTQSLLRDIAIAAIPLEYENDKQWGKTKEVWNGVHLKMDGLKLKTHGKRKEVNQGTWKRQRISLVEPDKSLQIQIGELQEIAPGRAAFQLTMSAKLDLFAQRQEWQRDIRIYSISAEATADVDLTVDFELTTELDMDKLPPDILLQPVAKKAELQLHQFKLHRISKADGPIVREFGDGLEGVFRRYLDDNQDKLTDKLNRAITKNQHKMRVSVTDLVRPKWLSNAESAK